MKSINQNKIRFSYVGLEKISPKRITNINGFLFAGIEKINKYLLDNLSIDVKCRHTIDDTSTYRKPALNIVLYGGYNKNDQTDSCILDYLEKGRMLILTTDYRLDCFFDVLTRKLTELIVDYDVQTNTQVDVFPDRVLKRAALALVIEEVTKIRSTRKSKYICTAHSTYGDYEINTFIKRTAIDLLGGYIKDEKSTIGNFLMYFKSVEEKIQFSLDGVSINACITNEDWLQLFNDNKIQLLKYNLVSVRFYVEISPINNQPVKYYITELSDKKRKN
jgi:hypothetical protein